MIDEIYYEIVEWIADVSTLLVFIFLLYRYTKLRHKNYSFIIVLILNLSCCILPLMSVITVFFDTTSEAAIIIAKLTQSGWHFSMFWSAAIGIFVLIVTTDHPLFNPRRFTKYALLVCLVMVLIIFLLILFEVSGLGVAFYAPGMFSLAFVGTTTGEKIGYLIIIDLWGRTAPVLVGLYCYVRVYLTLKSNYQYYGKYMKMQPARVLLYPGLQILCIMPGVIMDVVLAAQGLKPNTIASFVTSILHHSWAPLYLILYSCLNFRSNRSEVVATAPQTQNLPVEKTLLQRSTLEKKLIFSLSQSS